MNVSQHVKKIIYIFLLILFFFGIIKPLSSQVYYDSLIVLNKLDADSVISKLNHDDYFFNINYLHRYNRLGNDINIGNLGLPVLNLSLYNNVLYKDNDFNLSILNLPRTKNIFFKSLKPVTDFFYVLGSFKEQLLNLNHIQSVSKKLSFYVNYNKVKSEGFYKNQQTNNNHVNLGIEYRYNRYFSDVLFNFYDLNNNENGGLSDDSLFLINYYSNPRLYNVNLQNAKNKIKGASATFIQNFKLNTDTAYLKFNLFHKLQYSSFKRLYSDIPNNFFYSNILLDSNNTLDEFYYKSLGNELGINFITKSLNCKLSVLSGLSEYRNFIDTSTHNLGSVLFIGYSKKYFKLNILGDYYFAGYKAANYNINVNIDYSIKTFVQNIGLNLKTSYLSPYLDYMYLYSNHYYWLNNFDKMRVTDLKLLSVFKSKFQSAFQYTTINNFIYLDSSSLPNQRNGITGYFNLSADKEFELKYLVFQAAVIYQQVIKGQDILRFPEYIINTSVSYKNRLWSMDYQIGARFFYYAAFYSNLYNPALNSFYLQHDFKTGGYPYIDVFFNASIKNIKLLFMFTHINQGLSGTNYFSTVSYPMAGRAFKIGLNWTFIN